MVGERLRLSKRAIRDSDGRGLHFQQWSDDASRRTACAQHQNACASDFDTQIALQIGDQTHAIRVIARELAIITA